MGGLQFFLTRGTGFDEGDDLFIGLLIVIVLHHLNFIHITSTAISPIVNFKPFIYSAKNTNISYYLFFLKINFYFNFYQNRD